MNLPKFITFTGADQCTDIQRMIDLSAEFPIEWAVLFSPKRQDSGRYPPAEFVERLGQKGWKLKLAAHLCGDLARRIFDGEGLEPGSSAWHFIANCERVQVNTAQQLTNYQLRNVMTWAVTRDLTPILQTRDLFPVLPRVPHIRWLFDASGGRGIAPGAWPRPVNKAHSESVRKGYAGGLNPDNVAAAVADIGAHDENYWIDMETGVRDEHDRFSLDKCEQVCRAVFPKTVGGDDHGLRLG